MKSNIHRVQILPIELKGTYLIITKIHSTAFCGKTKIIRSLSEIPEIRACDLQLITFCSPETELIINGSILLYYFPEFSFFSEFYIQ